MKTLLISASTRAAHSATGPVAAGAAGAADGSEGGGADGSTAGVSSVKINSGGGDSFMRVAL